jgi:4-amino-4-deoxy-L-arabinose transferase-like glycosyltransferase
MLILVALALLAFFYGLGRIALVGPDEPRYAEVAREMFATGDYISPRLCGCLWFEKPALLYWMAAASYHLFGVSEFAARLPSALMATATVFALYLSLRGIFRTKTPFYASLVLATSGIFIAYGRAGTTDMALTAAMSVALLSGYLAMSEGERPRLKLWVLSFTSMGVAVLAKGLPGLVLVVAILALFGLLAGRLRAIRFRYILAGCAALLAVAATWYAPVTLRHGWQFVEEFFIRHHLDRYVSDDFGHPQPFYFFALVAIAGVVPWSIFLAPAAARLPHLRLRLSSEDSLVAFAWVWAVVVIAFYSVSRSKLPGYILPAFPALAIIIGVEVERFASGSGDFLMRFSGWATALALVAIGVGFIIYAENEGAMPSGWRLVFVSAPVILSAFSLLAALGKRPSRLVHLAAAAVLSVVVGAVSLLFPVLTDRLTLKSLSLVAAAALRPGEKITFFIKKEFAPVFYAEGRVVCGIEGESVLNALSQETLAVALDKSQSSLIVVTGSDWEDDLIGDERFVAEFVGRQGNALAYRVTLKPQSTGTD